MTVTRGLSCPGFPRVSPLPRGCCQYRGGCRWSFLLVICWVFGWSSDSLTSAHWQNSATAETVGEIATAMCTPPVCWPLTVKRQTLTVKKRNPFFFTFFIVLVNWREKSKSLMLVSFFKFKTKTVWSSAFHDKWRAGCALRDLVFYFLSLSKK